MQQHNISGQLSGVDDQVLASVTGYLPSLPNVQADDADRFAQAVRAIVERRAQHSWPNEKAVADVAVFVMVSYPRLLGQKCGANTPFTDLIATTVSLLGNLFVCNPDASSGRVMPMPVENPNSVIEWLVDNGLSNFPIIIVYRGTKTLITRRTGVDDYARPDPIRETPPLTTVEELLDALKYFHMNRLLTPSGGAHGVWEPKRAQNYIPGPQPEKSIQSDLTLALNHWFHGIVRAETEDSTNIGRIDVRLLKKSNEQGSLSYWAIIELKIIKSFTNASIGTTATKVADTTNINAIIKGIEQTWAFRENRDAEEGLLEIYDLRQEKQVNLMEHAGVIEILNKCSPIPTHNVRPVFGSSEDARHAGFAGI